MNGVAPAYSSLRLGLLGFGTVGQALVKLLQTERSRISERHGIDIGFVSIASRKMDPGGVPWLTTPVQTSRDLEAVVTDPNVDAVVELIGGFEPAGTLIETALKNHKHVITANKLLLAKRGEELQKLAAANGVSLRAEASVAGGIPLLRVLRESFTSDHIQSVSGILNGTCNFILTEMEKTGRSFEDALADAQRRGFAEADPSSDVDGLDAGYKLALVARIAFGEEVDVEHIELDGIRKLHAYDFVYSRQLGRTPRQLAVARRLPSGGLRLSVRTHMVSTGSVFASVPGPYNAILIHAENGGDFYFVGAGAGGPATATAVLSDVVELARSGSRPETPLLGHYDFSEHLPGPPEDFTAPFYLRFVVRDRPGILADICRILANHSINIEAVMQAPHQGKNALPFVITLEPVTEKQVLDALNDISAIDFNAEPPLACPMTP